MVYDIICYMGTSKGNYGREMYSDPIWKSNMSKSHLFKRINVTKACPKCGTKFTVIRKVNKQNIEIPFNKERECCSRKCSNSKSHTKETRQKISKGVVDKLGFRAKEEKVCLYCHQLFMGINKRKYCSPQCSGKDHVKPRKLDCKELRVYRWACRFAFNINNYPDKFDLNLIDMYGGYSAKNHGGNLNGVSRDHIISVRYGFDNNIDPNIIAHPANCELMVHGDNSSKGTKNGMTMDELLNRIQNW
jgi:hypothetical protein